MSLFYSDRHKELSRDQSKQLLVLSSKIWIEIRMNSSILEIHSIFYSLIWRNSKAGIWWSCSESFLPYKRRYCIWNYWNRKETWFSKQPMPFSLEEFSFFRLYFYFKISPFICLSQTNFYQKSWWNWKKKFSKIFNSNIQVGWMNFLAIIFFKVLKLNLCY